MQYVQPEKIFETTYCKREDNDQQEELKFEETVSEFD